jgi:hypothetical protein
MFRHRQSLSSIPHRRTKVSVSKSFSSISRVAFPARAKGEQKEREDGGWSAPKDPTMTVWKKTIGKQFEKPHRSCNWLGDKVVEFLSVCVQKPNLSLIFAIPFLLAFSLESIL